MDAKTHDHHAHGTGSCCGGKAPSSGAVVRDPVCGMTVDPTKAAATREHDGTTFYFCSAGCAETFDANTSVSIRARLRLLRGWCPACSSDPHSAEGCEVCRGYRGPFPADARTMQPWANGCLAWVRWRRTSRSSCW